MLANEPPTPAAELTEAVSFVSEKWAREERQVAENGWGKRGQDGEKQEVYTYSGKAWMMEVFMPMKTIMPPAVPITWPVNMNFQ
jgi:hypothetical protein